MLLQLLFSLLDLLTGGFKLLFGFGKGAVDRLQHPCIQGVDPGLIQFHPNLAFYQTAAGNGRDAVYPLQCRNHGGGGKLRKLLPRHIIAIHRQHHDGQHVWVDLHQNRTAGAIGQAAADLIEAGVHLDHGGIHAGAFLELQHHDADILLRNAGNVFNPAGGCQRLLQCFGHALLHLLRTGADVGGVGDRIGQIHIRQKVGGHIDKRHDAENEHQHDRYKYGHGLFNTEA